LTALAVSLVISFGGRMIFNFLESRKTDFRSAAGICPSGAGRYRPYRTGEKTRAPQTSVGVVPIGIPLS